MIIYDDNGSRPTKNVCSAERNDHIKVLESEESFALLFIYE